jgi:hypothetical protein
MNVAFLRLARRALVPVTVLALTAGCRDRAATSDNSALSTDSALARDIALAQRNDPGPLIFNDAPVGASPSARPAPGAPSTRREPPRATAPIPRPAPRREAPAPVSRTPSPAPAAESPAASPGPARGVIGAGTRLGMTTNGRVCAATALAGDKFTATLTSATTGTNGAVIPAGSTVVIEVASVDRADPIEASHITFRVRSIDVDGVARSADGDIATLGALEPVQTAGGNDRTKVIGGAVAGAILGRILGGSTKATVIGGAAGAAAGTVMAKRGQTTDACLPNGAPLRLTLSRDVVVPASGSL